MRLQRQKSAHQAAGLHPPAPANDTEPAPTALRAAALAGSAPRRGERRPLPLAVDLDGTLLAGDSLHEGFVALLLNRTPAAPGTIVALRHGRAAFKREVCGLVPSVPETLPLNEPFLAWLREQADAGRELHLLTAADQSVADVIAARLGIFATAIGSDGVQNLSGRAKARLLRSRFPEGFAYAGDRADDLPVFAAAREIVLVNARPSVAAAARRQAEAGGQAILAEFARRPRRLADWLGSLRLHQWSKNLLLLVPLALGHRLYEPEPLLRCVMGIIVLGIIASGTYILNDLSDLRADRQHATKRHRAFAAGRLPPLTGLVVGVALVLGGLVSALALGRSFAAGALGYVLLSGGYSLALKRVPLVDTLTIAALFTLRLVLGVELAEVPYSPWLLSFAAFFFFSLALAKRHGEVMQAAAGSGAGALARRGYVPEDWPLTLAFGVASGIASLLIMILFVVDDVAPSRLYHTPGWLFIAPAAVAVWLTRVWLLAQRRELHHDPVVFALRDPVSWGVGAAAAGAVILAALR
jgi:4-hydroxybenzoate polyprenyltransferase/phosphoserine phosphatase